MYYIEFEKSLANAHFWNSIFIFAISFSFVH